MNTALAKPFGAALLLAGSLSACATINLPANYVYSSDAQIATDVMGRLREHPDVWPQMTISVTDGVVYLRGIVPTELAKANAESYLRDVKGVKRIVDNAGVSE
jgi:osmotically-inducible protein OsmY